MFTVITLAEITTGEPVSFDTGTTIKENFDDHESRIASLETSSGAERPIGFYVKGEYYKLGTTLLSQILYDRLTFDITMLSGRLFLLDAGSSGTLEIDILFKRGVAAFASIFTTKPSIGFASSQFTINSGVLGTTAFLTNDILALSVTSVMTGNTEFLVELNYQAA